MIEKNSLNLNKYLSGTALKIIAIITMLIDHIGIIIIEKKMAVLADSLAMPTQNAQYMLFYNLNTYCRMIGRIAFPLFCFLLVEGFLHTKNIKKYLLSLLAFAFISEIPFDFVFLNQFICFDYQNVYFTLFIGLSTICLLDKCKHTNKYINALYSIIISIGGMLLAGLFKTDYLSMGVFLIILLYLFRNDRLKQCIIGGISFLWEPSSVIAFILMYLYNGERGMKCNKYIFYLFYPVHIILLYLISCLIK